MPGKTTTVIVVSRMYFENKPCSSNDILEGARNPSLKTFAKLFPLLYCLLQDDKVTGAAVTMSCFCAELQALQLLLPNSSSGIATALPLLLLYIFKFPDSRCRPLVSLSDNLNPFQQFRGGSISCVRMGHLAVRLPLPVAPHHVFLPSRVNV